MYFQKTSIIKFIGLVSLIVIAGCASGKVTKRQSNIQNEQIPRPDQIFVHDFAVTTDEISEPLVVDGNIIIQNSIQSVEETQRAKLLAVEIANDLVADISSMGLRAFHAGSDNKPRPGDIVLVVMQRLLAGLTDGFKPGEVDHRIDRMIGKQSIQTGAIANVAFDKHKRLVADLLDSTERLP